MPDWVVLGNLRGDEFANFTYINPNYYQAVADEN